MGNSIITIAKISVSLFSNEKFCKVIGWILVAILSPLILLATFLCCLSSGATAHNNVMMDYCFYGVDYTGEIPTEFEEQMTAIRAAFSSLDSVTSSVNAMAEVGGLDPIQLKAVYYILCSEGTVDASSFATCFYTLEERTRTVTTTNEDGEEVETEESYTVALPNSLHTAYQQLGTFLGRTITEREKESVQNLYIRIAGNGGEGYESRYLQGGDPCVELDVSAFIDPSTKNANDLAVYATHAWKSGWGYVWGTYGNILTDALLEYKVEQYPDGVGQYKAFIRSHWLNGRTTDCVGLIKGYGWLDTDSLTIKYGTNEMPDIGANAMYHNAATSGPISTMPDTPGLAVWMEGHIGVYIGDGEVIEASSTKKGVIKTQLAGRGWSHWLEVPYINYKEVSR